MGCDGTDEPFILNCLASVRWDNCNAPELVCFNNWRPQVITARSILAHLYALGWCIIINRVWFYNWSRNSLSRREWKTQKKKRKKKKIKCLSTAVIGLAFKWLSAIAFRGWTRFYNVDIVQIECKILKLSPIKTGSKYLILGKKQIVLI